jgi:protein-S-isoprenylcysteine O-methyltransferase Ste14
MVTVVIPALILWRTGVSVEPLTAILGALLILLGLALVVWTVRLLVMVGRGTLAPWDATTSLVVHGPYRHVRNPMISGVAAILAGEALFFRSWPIAVCLAVFALVNGIYLPLSEEPGLSRRFGQQYERYRANVPRWLPRLRAWSP